MGKFQFLLRVPKNVQSVELVSTAIGCEKVNNVQALGKVFHAPLKDIIRRTGAEMNLSAGIGVQSAFKFNLMEAVSTEINGFVLDDVVIEYMRALKNR